MWRRWLCPTDLSIRWKTWTALQIIWAGAKRIYFVLHVCLSNFKCSYVSFYLISFACHCFNIIVIICVCVFFFKIDNNCRLDLSENQIGRLAGMINLKKLSMLNLSSNNFSGDAGLEVSESRVELSSGDNRSKWMHMHEFLTSCDHLFSPSSIIFVFL